MSKHPLDEIAEKWNTEWNKYFVSQSFSENVYELELSGNKRTGNQIENWQSPSSDALSEK